MKIVILGAVGRLGAALVREFRPKYDVAGFDHAQLDLSNLDDLREKVGATTFDVLINAAAFTNVDACETERDSAFLINADATWYSCRNLQRKRRKADSLQYRLCFRRSETRALHRRGSSESDQRLRRIEACGRKERACS